MPSQICGRGPDSACRNTASSTSIALPRQTTLRPDHPRAQRNGNRRSRTSQAAGLRHDNGQPAGEGEDGLSAVAERSRQRDADNRAYPEVRRGDRSGDEGEKAGRQDLWSEKEWEGGAPQPGPTKLPPPDVAQTSPAERLLERPVDEMGVEPLRPDDLGRRRVFRDFRRLKLQCFRPLRESPDATAWSCPGRTRSRTIRPHIASAPDRC